MDVNEEVKFMCCFFVVVVLLFFVVFFSKKNRGGQGEGRGRVGGGGQGGCERRIEVFVKIKKKIGGCRVGEGGSGRMWTKN